ncbi:MAG: antibiotic biosynthesis monooxygenase [Stagnimonas sp.]|nr:antibiotic biosynthesis monooxygenase [Stagnimonas sp.]
MSFSKLPAPPYYAVIFCSQRPDADDGYVEMADQMAELATTMPGYLGRESARGSDGFGITVSYWQDEVAIANWKANMDHKAARDYDRTRWYEHYELRVAKVERAYGKPKGSA